MSGPGAPVDRRRSEAGQVTAFVTIFVVALLFVIGLVLDGGYVIAAQRRAGNVAAQAARAGAQQLDAARLRREGVDALDVDAARVAAAQFLAAEGADGDVRARADGVDVTVRIERRLLILGIGGLRSITVSGSGSARGVRG